MSSRINPVIAMPMPKTMDVREIPCVHACYRQGYIAVQRVIATRASRMVCR